MNRGVFILVLQAIVCIGIFGLGLWSLTRPKHLQHFINSNYALLPAARDGWHATPIFLRFVGIFLLWYGYTFAAGFRDEPLWLGRILGIVA